MTNQPTVTLTLRLPPNIHEAVTDAAEFDRRSVNGQIVYLLAKVLKVSIPKP